MDARNLLFHPGKIVTPLFCLLLVLHTFCSVASAETSADITDKALLKQATALLRSQNLTDLQGLAKAHPKMLRSDFTKGTSLLHTAVRAKNTDAVDWLLEESADPDAKMKLDGSTPLHSAVTHKNSDITTLLLQHGANPNATDNKRRTPIFRALYEQRLNNADLLFEFGADLDHVELVHSRTVLHEVVTDEKLESAKWLIDNGADVTLLDAHGSGLLELAVHATSKRTTNAIPLIGLLRDAGLVDMKPAYDYLVENCGRGYPREVLAAVDWLMLEQLGEGVIYEPLINLIH